MDLKSSGWGVLGLTIEILGLGFLFYDLLRTKWRDKSADAISTFQENLEIGGRDLILRTVGSFSLVVDFLSKYLDLHSTGDIPKELEGPLVKAFADARARLPTNEDLDEYDAKELVAKAKLVKSFNEQVATSDKLLRAALIGIALVLGGAFLQWLDQVLI